MYPQFGGATMRKGQKVTVEDFEGKKLERRVVGEVGDIVFICKEEEFEAAERDGREAHSIGFKKKWILKS